MAVETCYSEDGISHHYHEWPRKRSTSVPRPPRESSHNVEMASRQTQMTRTFDVIVIGTGTAASTVTMSAGTRLW